MSCDDPIYLTFSHGPDASHSDEMDIQKQNGIYYTPTSIKPSKMSLEIMLFPFHFNLSSNTKIEIVHKSNTQNDETIENEKIQVPIKEGAYNLCTLEKTINEQLKLIKKIPNLSLKIESHINGIKVKSNKDNVAIHLGHTISTMLDLPYSWFYEEISGTLCNMHVNPYINVYCDILDKDQNLIDSQPSEFLGVFSLIKNGLHPLSFKSDIKCVKNEFNKVHIYFTDIYGRDFPLTKIFNKVFFTLKLYQSDLSLY